MTMMSTQRLQALQPTLGDRMKKSLKVARISRWEISDYLDVAPETVSTWMNDHIAPSKQTLMLWALKTDVPMEWLETGKAPSEDEAPGDVRPEGFEPPAY